MNKAGADALLTFVIGKTRDYKTQNAFDVAAGSALTYNAAAFSAIPTLGDATRERDAAIAAAKLVPGNTEAAMVAVENAAKVTFDALRPDKQLPVTKKGDFVGASQFHAMLPWAVTHYDEKRKIACVHSGSIDVKAYMA